MPGKGLPSGGEGKSVAGTPAFSTYDPDKVVVMLGTIICDGFAEGSLISMSIPPSFVMVRGADGKVTRSKTLDKTATLRIKLAASSATNDDLSALLLADETGPNGAGVAPLFIKDSSGRSLYTGAQAWISKHPDVDFDDKVTPREWEISVARLIKFTGGN